MAESKKDLAILAQVKAKALVDSEYRQKLVADPEGVLKAAGLTIDPSLKVTVVESTATERYLVLPYVEKGCISEEQLARLAGGTGDPLQVQVVGVTVGPLETCITAQPGPNVVAYIGTEVAVV